MLVRIRFVLVFILVSSAYKCLINSAGYTSDCRWWHTSRILRKTSITGRDCGTIAISLPACFGTGAGRPQQGPSLYVRTLDNSTDASCQTTYETLHDPTTNRERLYTAVLLQSIEGHHLCDVGIS